jgi:predicted dehydrogenase
VERLYPSTRTATDYREILTDLTTNAVAIATPAQTHYVLAKEAFLAGKHVLVEKPLAMSSAQAEELVALATQQGKVLMVGHTFEYNPAVHKIKELIASGQIGDIYYIYSTRVNLGLVQRDLNALWSIAPHDISILIYLLESMPLEVSARGASYLNKNVEDVVFVNLLFPRGVVAQVHGSWLDPSKVRRMTVVGSQKMVIYDDVDDEGKIKVYDKGVYKKGDPIFGEFQYKVHSGDIYIPKIDMTEPLRNECAHFIECIQEGKKPLTDGENGLRVVRVLEAAQKSLENRGTVVEINRG